jgi:hypothetical protein
MRAFCHSARLILPRRRAGRIAVLPQYARDQVNLMMRDGYSYAAIIASLGDAGSGLNKHNLSRWRKAGHQDWLAERYRVEAAVHHPSQQPEEIKDVVQILNRMDSKALQTAISRQPTALAHSLSLLAKLVTRPSAARPSPPPVGPSASAEFGVIRQN